jgi:hypothetical protein
MGGKRTAAPKPDHRRLSCKEIENWCPNPFNCIAKEKNVGAKKTGTDFVS